jgi:predicted ATP-dependent protease
VERAIDERTYRATWSRIRSGTVAVGGGEIVNIDRETGLSGPPTTILSGRQGVIAPAANAQHLMLKEEVVDAVPEAQFNVWAISGVDEGLEILTGVPAEERRPDGTCAEGTIHRRVADRLAERAEIGRRFREPSQGAETIANPRR